MAKETLLAPVSGIVSQIVIPTGSFVQVDELIISIEVMKLFYNVTAGINGKLNIVVNEGEFVAEGDVLGTIEG